MSIIYHITTRKQWEGARKQGSFTTESLIEEGFIHCSQEKQIPEVLERFFQGQSDLVKLVVDTDKLSSQLIYEWSPGFTDTFPHIYGPINLEAILDVLPLENGSAPG